MEIDTFQHPILLFDGVCNLCQGSIQFVIRFDPKDRFRFAPLQSDTAKRLLLHYEVEDNQLSSVILIYQNRIYRKSKAALYTLKLLRFPWPLFFIFIIIPHIISDKVYDFIGNHRYIWFGKKNHCWLPNKTLENKFLN